jgi:nitrile hydratase beta subunit
LDLGAAARDPNEPQFHHPWEARVMGMAVALGPLGRWTLDHSRSARELLPRYRSNSYYQTWFDAMSVLLAERGLVDVAALAAAAGTAPTAGTRDPRALAPERVDSVLDAGSPSLRPSQQPPRFVRGDRVRVRDEIGSLHTRAPGYVRGRTGQIVEVHGAHVFPDRRVQRRDPPFDECPEWLYTVVFDGASLWGAACEPGIVVSFDAFEPYLEQVDSPHEGQGGQT